tara:strand:- start:360 stop:842 length:483 start_codon:yes stop_codon:yes gene_type:complete
MRIENFVSHELQLGNQIAQAVSHEKPTDFAFLLALLSKDAMHMSQFKLEHSLDPPEHIVRKQLSVQEPQPLIKTFDQLSQHDISSLFHEGGLSTVRLYEALNPKALHYDSSPSRAMLEALHSAPVECRFDDAERYSIYYIQEIPYSELLRKQRLMSSMIT